MLSTLRNMNSITKDPLSWAQRAVGSQGGYMLAIGAHLVGTLAICWIGRWHMSIVMLAWLFSFWFPVLGLYALRRIVLSMSASDGRTDI